jgi:predicted RNA-binding Zn ribbon-like protein
MATAEQIREIYATRLQGNHLALDFVNGVDWRLSARRRDLVPDETALLHWGRRLGVVAEAELGAAVGKRDLDRAIELRELLYEIFAAIAAEGSQGQPVEVRNPDFDHLTVNPDPGAEQLRRLTEHYSEAVREGTLEPAGDGFRWTWADRDPADRIRWTVSVAAMDLLLSDQLERVKQCRDDACGWLFLDMSRNRSRRWCSMQECGARAKMRRQYRRKKEEDQAR